MPARSMLHIFLHSLIARLYMAIPCLWLFFEVWPGRSAYVSWFDACVRAFHVEIPFLFVIWVALSKIVIISIWYACHMTLRRSSCNYSNILCQKYIIYIQITSLYVKYFFIWCSLYVSLTDISCLFSEWCFQANLVFRIVDLNDCTIIN